MGTRANDIASLIRTGNTITAEKLNVGQLGGRRNLIINGAMQVAQRGTSEPGLGTTNDFDYFTVDRFKTGLSGLGTWTQTQSSDAPDGFSSSLKLECTTANASPAASAYGFIKQDVEGQDLQHLKKGTSSAESLTASFWVKSNKTDTCVLEIRDNDNSFRHINKSFTINASGTWEYKTVTFPGDTTGALNSDNTAGLTFQFWFGAGSNFTGGTLQTSWGTLTEANRAVGQVNLADSPSNYFQITGVQLELGDTATPFEHRSFGEELALCQRYYYEFDLPSDYTPGGAGNGLYRAYAYPVTMRATPTGSIVTQCQYLSTAAATNYTPTVSGSTSHASVNKFDGLTNATGVWSGRIGLDAEL